MRNLGTALAIALAVGAAACSTPPRDEITGSAEGTDCVSGSAAISARASSTEPARASCVTACSVAPPSRC